MIAELLIGVILGYFTGRWIHKENSFKEDTTNLWNNIKRLSNGNKRRK